MRVYLVGWPNGTWSVLGFPSKPSDSDLTFCVDAIGDPSVASVFLVKRDERGDFAFDFPKTPAGDTDKPALPDCPWGDMIPVWLNGDIKDLWEARQEELRELLEPSDG